MSRPRRATVHAAAWLATACVAASCSNPDPLGAQARNPDSIELRVPDAVSAKLTSPGVAALNAAVSGNSGVDPVQAARKYLRDNGFNHPLEQ